jgi:AraC-like DNA-binding protein
MTGTRGILNPTDGLERFALQRMPAPGDLVGLVERFWHVRWTLPAGTTFAQETLPAPCVHLAWQNGRFEVHGPGTRRFVVQLRGRGSVLGTRFTPAGFAPFARIPLRTLVDRVLSVEEATGRAPSLPKNDAADSVMAVVSAFLRDFSPRLDDEMKLANSLVARAQQNPDVARAADLAASAGISERSLHRLFERQIGVAPKWIVRRARVQEAAERVARGARVDWAATAQQLGYHDQAHLIRDFRAQVGVTPAAYARRCAAAVRSAAAACEVVPDIIDEHE